ncbi:MAG: hypothetical protein EAX96_18165 [Candidatus Lokiarchaeota archaeon]|nr:hypothetical protein [Candidatus Lokiarchaeota archaeon]
MEFYEILDKRKSIRQFKSEFPSDRLIYKIIQKAIQSPNAHNSQPWKFIILKNYKVKLDMINEMGKKFAKDLMKDGISNKEIEKIVEYSHKKFMNAPILIIPCLDKNALPHIKDEERKENEYIMGVQSVSSAITYLLLAAHAEGLSSCWYCAALFTKEIIQKHLNLDINLEPQCIITIGYADEDPKKPKRKPLSEIVIEI